MCMFGCAYVHMCAAAWGGQKNGSIPLELSDSPVVVVDQSIWVLGP